MKFIHKEKTNILMFMLTFVILGLTAGCMANYGKYRPSSEVDKMFESRQLPRDLKYYYTGSAAAPEAIIGITNDYALDNDLWVETDIDAQKLKLWIESMTDNRGWSHYTYGHYIFDPNGKNIGIYYSRFDGGSIKVESENKIIINTPDMRKKERRVRRFKNISE